MKSRPVRPLRWSTGTGGVSTSAHSTGTMVTATNSDIISEKITTTDSCRNSTLEKPARKNSGTNTATWVSVEARIADQISSLPSMRRLARRLAHVHVALGVLEHHDGGVDDHADAEGQAAEGHRVQRVAAEVEQGEGAEDRDRDRGADDDRRADAAQEGEDDEDDEERAEDHRFADRVRSSGR